MKATFELPKNEIAATFKIQKVVPADDYIRKDEFDNILNVDQVINEIRKDVIDIADVVEDMQLHKAAHEEIKNGQLVINVNDEQIGTFNANAEENQRINIDVPTHMSELLNDLNLTTLKQVEHLIAQIQQFKHEVVEQLPEIGNPSIMYLVPKKDAQNVYEEYIWLENLRKYEDIGSTAIDLSDYAKIEQLPSKVSELENDEGYLKTHQDISNLVTKSELMVQLLQKADSDLSNARASYDWVVVGNRTSKYRKWRNGRLQCEGITRTSATGEMEIALPMPYKDTEFTARCFVRELGNFFISCYPSGNQKIKVRVSDRNHNPISVQVKWETDGETL